MHDDGSSFDTGCSFEDETTYGCAFCGEPNGIDIDISAGLRQHYVEDCQVCCRPNVIHLSFDETGRAYVEAEMES
ncbi:MAG: CPXCG motif-containing cysteine-rich protein [Acidobacteriota bacterium]